MRIEREVDAGGVTYWVEAEIRRATSPGRWPRDGWSLVSLSLHGEDGYVWPTDLPAADLTEVENTILWEAQRQERREQMKTRLEVAR